jgi:tRNA (cytidine32/uridine32-2'-O)-methyltransferase
MLQQVHIVLVGTQHPGNIGSAARALRTMGLSSLRLVAPEAFPHPEASALAAGADEVLQRAAVHDDLPPAIADCRLLIGTSARRRGVSLPLLAPEEAAVQLLDAAADGPVGLLFGRERTGLTNDELQRCHAAVMIPTDPDFSSLNLAAAVQVLAYTLRREWLARQDGAAPAAPRRAPPASSAELEGLFAHLDRALHAIDFHKGRSPATVLRRLRRIYLRAGLDQREVRILRGILADAERMARLAGHDPLAQAGADERE